MWDKGSREWGNGISWREGIFLLVIWYFYPSINISVVFTNIPHYIAFYLEIKWIGQQRSKIPCKYRCTLISITDFEESTGIVQRETFKSKFYIQIIEILDGFLNMAFTAWGVNGREQQWDNSFLSYLLVTSDWNQNNSCETFEDLWDLLHEIMNLWVHKRDTTFEQFQLKEKTQGTC